MVYYSPALQVMRGRLCPVGTLSQKLAAMREKCIVDSWPDKLNDARIESNTLAVKAFHAHFGNKKLKVFSSPRLQCLLSSDIAVNMHPELCAEVDGVQTVWKLHMSKDKPTQQTISLMLQMLARALKHKGMELPIKQICFVDLRSGRIHREQAHDLALLKKLSPVSQALVHQWEAAA